MGYPGTNELITLAEFKSLTNTTATSYDAFLTAQIPAISRAIESYCRRRFLTNTWVQWCSVDRVLITDNWPITQVLMIGVPYICFTITDTTNTYNFSITQTTSNNLNVVPQFTVTNTSTWAVTSYPFATYTTVGALKSAVEGAIAGVTFSYGTLPTTVTMSSINTLSLRQTNGKTVYFGANYFDQTTSNPVGDVYRISDNSDRIFLNPNFYNASKVFGNGYDYYSTGWGNIDPNNQTNLDNYQPDDIMLAYISGYTTADVPTDLKQVTCNILKDIVTLYDLDGSGVYRGIFSSEKLGDYSYDLPDSSMISKLITDRYADALDYYKKKVI